MTQAQDRKKNYAPVMAFSFVQAGFWMSFCISVSFSAVYLLLLGYSNGGLGLIVALGSIMGIVLSISLSAWIDEREEITAKRIVPWMLSLYISDPALRSMP